MSKPSLPPKPLVDSPAPKPPVATKPSLPAAASSALPTQPTKPPLPATAKPSLSAPAKESPVSPMVKDGPPKPTSLPKPNVGLPKPIVEQSKPIATKSLVGLKPTVAPPSQVDFGVTKPRSGSQAEPVVTKPRSGSQMTFAAESVVTKPRSGSQVTPSTQPTPAANPTSPVNQWKKPAVEPKSLVNATTAASEAQVPTQLSLNAFKEKPAPEAAKAEEVRPTPPWKKETPSPAPSPTTPVAAAPLLIRKEAVIPPPSQPVSLLEKKQPAVTEKPKVVSTSSPVSPAAPTVKSPPVKSPSEVDLSALDDIYNELDKLVTEAARSPPGSRPKAEVRTPLTPTQPIEITPRNPAKVGKQEDDEIQRLLNEIEGDGSDFEDTPKSPELPANWTKPTAPIPPKPQEHPPSVDDKDDDIDRLLDELDVKLGRSPHGSARTTQSTSSSLSSSFPTPELPPPLTAPKLSKEKETRYTALLQNLQADLDQLGIDETELPEEKPMKFKHLSENIDLDKLKQMAATYQVKDDPGLGAYSSPATPYIPSSGSQDKLSVKLYHGAACLLLRIAPGAEGSIVLQQAIQKCGGVGHLDDFTLYFVANDQEEERKLIGEKMIVYDLIAEIGENNCKMVLEKVQNAKAFSIILAVSKGDYYLNDCGVSVAEGDMFYVLDRDGLTWRVKPISRNGKDFDIPRDYLQIDPEGWKKLQYKYGQKVYFDQGEPVAGPKASKLTQLKSFTSKMMKSMPNIKDITSTFGGGSDK